MANSDEREGYRDGRNGEKRILTRPFHSKESNKDYDKGRHKGQMDQMKSDYDKKSKKK